MLQGNIIKKEFCFFSLLVTRYSLLVTLIIVLLIFTTGCGTSYQFKKISQAEDIPLTPIPATVIEQLPVGEKLTYEIRWMGIPVAIAVLNVKEITKIQGKDVYHIVAMVNSNKFLSAFYKVDDEFHSYIQKDRFRTLRFTKRQAEGRYRSDEITDYDYATLTATYRSLLNNSVKTTNIPEEVHDDLSAIYYFRLKEDIQLSETIFMDVNADEKNWKVEARVLYRGVMNLKDIGAFDAFVVEPSASCDGKKLTKGRIWIWFSADKNRIPLAASAKAAIIGTANAVLTKIE